MINNSNNDNQYDFIAVGDITTDAFIQIPDADVLSDVSSSRSWTKICFNFGDKVAYDKVYVLTAVGNSPNAAMSATRLGAKAALMTDIGDDQNGKDNLAKLEENGIDTTYVRTHAGEVTNYHYVLWHKEERTILVKHQEYDYVFPHNMPAPKYMYLSSLAHNSLPYHNEIATYLEAHPETKLIFQPGTFQMKLGTEKLAAIYARSFMVVCNKEEAQRILQTDEQDIKELMKGMRSLGADISVVSDGPNGAYAYDGTDAWFVPMYPDPKPPIERTGAGDAFTSTMATALILGKSLPEALEWGPINSMNVVQHIGAQEGLLDRATLEEHLKNAPENYKATKI